MKRIFTVALVFFLIQATAINAAKEGYQKNAPAKTVEFVPELQFDEAEHFQEGRAKIKINGKYGFIDKTGKFAVEPQFDYAMMKAHGAEVNTSKMQVVIML